MKDFTKLKDVLRKTNFEPIKSNLKNERKHDELREIKLIEQKMLDLRQKRVDELRSYKIPPLIIHQAVKGTLVLVSIPEKEASQWDKCLSYLTNIGNNSIYSRIKKFKLFEVNSSTIKKVHSIIKDIKKKEIISGSRCAAAFLHWTRINVKTYSKLNKLEL